MCRACNIYCVWCSSVSGYLALQPHVQPVILILGVFHLIDSLSCLRIIDVSVYLPRFLSLLMEVKSPCHGAAHETLISPTCSCHFTAPCHPRYLLAVTVALLFVSHVCCYVGFVWWLHVVIALSLHCLCLPRNIMTLNSDPLWIITSFMVPFLPRGMLIIHCIKTYVGNTHFCVLLVLVTPFHDSGQKYGT